MTRCPECGELYYLPGEGLHIEYQQMLNEYHREYILDTLAFFDQVYEFNYHDMIDVTCYAPEYGGNY